MCQVFVLYTLRDVNITDLSKQFNFDIYKYDLFIKLLLY